jgi:ABC-type oligopeptide transport system substrate-binding subunit
MAEKSLPSEQMRVLLDKARSLNKEFDAAYEFAFSRIRWPHDTTHRREWKALLGDYESAREVNVRREEVSQQIEIWRSAYYNQRVESRYQSIRHILSSP